MKELPSKIKGFIFWLALFSCAPEKNASTQTLPNGKFDSDKDESLLFKNAKRAFPPQSGIQESQNEFLWPLEDSIPSLLTRFGTPTIAVESRVAEQSNWNIAYMHDALDIKWSHTGVPTDVKSPTSGMAVVVGQTGNPYSMEGDPYDLAVIVEDEKTKTLLGLLHVIPKKELFSVPGKKVKVSRGQVIGNLAEVTSLKDVNQQKNLSHVHLFQMSADRKRLLNPALSFEKYRDTEAPVAVGAYLLNSKGSIVQGPFGPGAYDLIIIAKDRDGINQMNFEISNIEFEILGSSGKLFKKVDKCNLDHIVGEYTKDKTNLLLDLENSRSQVTDSWVNGLADADNPERTFRYAITQISKKDEAGNCALFPDDNSGFIEIESVESKISVQGKIYDWAGNEAGFSFKLK
jgi:hypothetical protein